MHRVAAASLPSGLLLICLCDVVVGHPMPDSTILRAAVSSSVLNQCVVEQAVKVTAMDPWISDNLGWSVAISGDIAVCGAPFKRNNSFELAGAAYVYVRVGGTFGWVEQTKLTPSDAAAYDEFGYSVAVSGNTIVVGSHQDDDAGENSGSVYVWTTTNGEPWHIQAKLTAADTAADDHFGWSVSISGDTVLVGSYADDHAGGSNAGAAYVFVRDGVLWTPQAKLVASDTAATDYFGYSVALYGNTAVIGSVFDVHAGGPGGANGQGSAYVFRRTGVAWGELAKLTASDAAASDRFGESVAVNEETVVVGACDDDHAGGIDAGSAYVFIQSGNLWPQQAKLIASNTNVDDQFGSSVAIAVDSALVGAHNAGANNEGTAYQFERTGAIWNEQAVLLPFDGGVGDKFGDAVALSNDTALVGARNHGEIVLPNAGAAYTFAKCCIPAPSGLVAWWPLDEEENLGVSGINRDVRDLSPNKLHGDIAIQPAINPGLGKVDGAYIQGGISSPSSLIVVPHDPAIGFDTGSFTIDAWVRLFGQADASTYRYVVSKMTGPPILVGYRFGFFNDKLVLTLGNGFPVSFNSGYTITDDEWHFVAVTVNRGNNALFQYVDGEQVSAGDLSVFSGSIGNSVPLQIGEGNSPTLSSPGFFGMIDEVELFDRALTPEEVNAIYLAGAAGKCKCLCPADVNQDNVIDGLDIGAFNRCLLGQTIDGDFCACADMNADDAATTDDIDSFVSTLLNMTGTCPPY